MKKMTHTPNNSIYADNPTTTDIEISMLPSSPDFTPTSKKIRTPAVAKLRSWTTRRGFKVSNLFLTVAIGIIILIEIKIMYETTRTYNESLVNQLSQKNEMLEKTLINLTSSHKDRNDLLDKLLRLNEDFKVDAMNRSEHLEDRIEETQQLVIQMAKENKLMYDTGEKSFMDTLKLVREALTMNTNTVIRLLDENSEIQNKLRELEENVGATRRRKSAAWGNSSSKSTTSITAIFVVILVNFLAI